MPINWTIGPSLVLIRVRGFAAYNLKETIAQIIGSPLFKPSKSLLLDRSGATDEPSSTEVRARAQEIKALLVSRCAVVVAPKSYNLGRMLREFLESEGIRSEVFTDAAEAERWLSVEEANAKAV